jgi:hypothetical protein
MRAAIAGERRVEVVHIVSRMLLRRHKSSTTSAEGQRHSTIDAARCARHHNDPFRHVETMCTRRAWSPI